MTPLRIPMLLLILSSSVWAAVPRLPALFVRSEPADLCRFRVHQVGFSACFEDRVLRFQFPHAEVAMRFKGASKDVRAKGLPGRPGSVTYMLGDEPGQWRSRAIIGGVAYRSIYPGIDAMYTADTNRLKAEFIVFPGADPDRIRLQYDHVKGIRISEGSLLLDTDSGVFQESPLYVFQEIRGRRVTIRAEYQIHADRTIGFQLLDSYDRSAELRIDPVLSYSTFLGGGGIDRICSVAVGNDGSAYVAGFTDSIDLSTTTPAFQRYKGGSVDAFVARIAPDGSSVLYWTYLGGSADDRALSISVDTDGNAYVAGSTTSANFPTKDAHRNTLAGGRDAFLAKLNSSGTALVYSTYVGGAGTDIANAVAIDSSRNVYLAGSTTSSNFPVLGAAQLAIAGQTDAFVLKMNAAGNALGYATYLGGSGDDRAYGIALDSAGSAVVAGVTNSSNFPVVSAAQASIGGGQDIFISKLSPSGSTIQVSTYFGGSRNETMEAGSPLALDETGAAIIAGTTTSTNLPVSGAPYPIYRGGSSDAFVAKLNSGGSSVAYCTYVGGSALDYGIAVTLVEGSKPYLVGYTASSNFPTVNTGPVSLAGGYDVFAVRLNSAGSQIERSEVFGGSENDAPYGVASDSSGNLYIGGQTGSGNFPVESAVQSSTGGNLSGFLIKIPSPGVPMIVSLEPGSGTAASQSFSLVVSDSDGYQDLTEASFLVAPTSDSIAGCLVRYTRMGNTLELRDDLGTGWVGPAGVGSGSGLENNYCMLSTASASVNGSGSNLTLVLPVTFRGSFSGAKNLFARVRDSSGSGGIWQNMGTWTVPSGGTTPPTLNFVSPSSGSGGQQVFAFEFSSVYGFTDIKWAFVNFTPNGNTPNACMGRYIQATNRFELATNAASGWVGSHSVGTPGTLENSQCRVDLGASSVIGSGSLLQLNLSVTFKSVFAGEKTIMMAALNSSDILAGWTPKGTWNVNMPSAPVPVSVTPSAGSGDSRLFDFLFTDANGFSDITWTAILIHSALAPTSSCLIRVTRGTNVVELANDAGSFTGGVALGNGGVIQNSQCTVNASSSSLNGAGSNLTISLSISFKPAYSGSKNVYMTVADSAGAVAPWTARGTWTVP